MRSGSRDSSGIGEDISGSPGWNRSWRSNCWLNSLGPYTDGVKGSTRCTTPWLRQALAERVSRSIAGNEADALPISASDVRPLRESRDARVDVRHGGSVAGEPLAQDTKQLVQGGVLSYGHVERLPRTPVCRSSRRGCWPGSRWPGSRSRGSSLHPRRSLQACRAAGRPSIGESRGVGPLGSCRGPALKYRRLTTGIPYARRNTATYRSAAAFVTAYGESGFHVRDSSLGRCGSSP